MKNLTELNSKQLLEINGGTEAYSWGRRVGYAAGKLLGHFENALEGLYGLLD